MNELTKEQLVTDLKEILRNSVKSRIEFISDENKLKPEGYLANLSNLYSNLSESDKNYLKWQYRLKPNVMAYIWF